MPKNLEQLLHEKFNMKFIDPEGVDANDFAEVTHYYMSKIDRKEDVKNAKTQLGYAYGIMGDYQKSRSWFQKAFEMDGNATEALLGFARVCELQQDFENMLRAARKAQEQSPKNKEAKYLILRARYGLTGQEMMIDEKTYIGSLRSPVQGIFERCNPFNKESGIRKCAEEVQKHAGIRIGAFDLGIYNYNHWLVLVPVILFSPVVALFSGESGFWWYLNHALTIWLLLGVYVWLIRNTRLKKLMLRFGKHLKEETGEYYADPDLLEPGEEYELDCGGGKKRAITGIYQSWYKFDLKEYLVDFQNVLNRHWWYHLRQMEEQDHMELESMPAK